MLSERITSIVFTSTAKNKMNNSTVAIIGYACDEGVRRNNGRVGAKDGPDAIRKCMGKFPPQSIDKGNIIYEDGNMEKTQQDIGIIQFSSRTVKHALDSCPTMATAFLSRVRCE